MTQMFELLALKYWLRGRWALLFSHPDDFAVCGFEADRWLVHVQAAFAAAEVRPLALAGRHASRWVTQVGGCATCVALDELQPRPDARFVMTLDAALRVRRTFLYTPQDRLPSPMDLAGLARRLRERDRTSRTIAPGTPAIPCRR